MEKTKEPSPEMDCEVDLRFELPFIKRAIHLDVKGAQHIAWLACQKAERNTSPIENKKRLARQMAAFICGSIVAGVGNDAMWHWVYEEFLPLVHDWLDKACRSCFEEEPDWTVFFNNPDIVRDMRRLDAEETRAPGRLN